MKLDIYKYNLNSLAFLLVFATILVSCNRLKEKAKEGIHKSGETVGAGASEFISGVNKGVDETFGCTLSISEGLSQKGLKTGKFKVATDSTGKENVLTAYLIFDNDFSDVITAKLFDTGGLEYGRSNMNITARKGEAKYFDFIFDSRTNIESKSKFTLE